MAGVTVTRTAAGIYSLPNSLNSIPEGALLEASNVSIDRDGLISKRRGFDRFGQALSAKVEAMSEYQDRLLLHDGTRVRYDSNGFGAWSPWTGNYAIPEAGDASRMHFAEYKENIYFTTDLGIYKNDDLTTDPVLSGMPPGLDIQPSLIGTGGGFFLDDTQIAYRVVWGRVDRNFALILGAPSTREVVTNAKTTALAWSRTGAGPWTITVTHTAHGYSNGDIIEVSDALQTGGATAVSMAGSRIITFINSNSYSFSVPVDPGAATGTLSAGKKFNVQLIFTIPDGIVPEDFYEVYRTDFSASGSIDPGDRCLKLKRVVVTATDLLSKTVTFTDTSDSVFLEEDLYTNSEREGVEQANTRSPWAKDIAAYNGALFFANTMREEAIEIRLLTTAGIIEGTDSITLTADSVLQTYTAQTAENIAARQWDSVQAGTALESQKVERAAKSLIRVINRDPANTKFYAFYVSEIDKAPGTIAIERRTLNTGQFFVNANNATFANKWSPQLATSGNSLGSDNNRGKNLLFWSKFDQPEAVPEGNFEPVGSEQYEILRILRIKDSLIILKEDGVYRVSGPRGERPDPQQLDPTIILAAPEAACVGDAAVWCLSTQGVVRITESGTEVISRQIEDKLKSDIFQAANYKFTTQAVFYESAREFLLIAPGQGAGLGNDPTVIWAYNYFTGPDGLRGNWVRKYEKRIAAAHVLSPGRIDKLYLSHDIDLFILEERKSTIGIEGSVQMDYQDETLEGITVSTVDTTTNDFDEDVSTVTITGWTYWLDPAEGWGFSQDGTDAKILSVTSPSSGTFVLMLDRFSGTFAPGDAELAIGIRSRIRWAPEEADTVAIMKRWSEVHIYLQSDVSQIQMTFRVGFRTDIWDQDTLPFVTREFFVSNIRKTFLENYPYELIRVYPLPYQVQRSRAIGLVFDHKYNMEPFHILNVAYKYLPLSSRVQLASDR
jgi:hypothetical protein